MKKLLIMLCLCTYVPICVCAVESQHVVFKKTKNKIGNEENSTDEKKKEPKKEKINESDFQPVLLGSLLDKPDNYLSKKIKFRGKFSSFTTLALDYEPALRKAKDFISIAIFRPKTKIPLSELKLAYPVKEAKENQVIRELEEGDLIEIHGEVFSTALDEPWVDILSIQKIESAFKSLDDKVVQEKKEEGNNTKRKNLKKEKIKK